jgi:hypothetical protein
MILVEEGDRFDERQEWKPQPVFRAGAGAGFYRISFVKIRPVIKDKGVTDERKGKAALARN